jgi:hypothetical protein
MNHPRCIGRLAQSVRALVLHTRGRGFESLAAHPSKLPLTSRACVILLGAFTRHSGLAVGLLRSLFRSRWRSFLWLLAPGLCQFKRQEPRDQNQDPRDNDPVHIHGSISFQCAFPHPAATRRRAIRSIACVAHSTTFSGPGTASSPLILLSLADMKYNLGRRAWKHHQADRQTLAAPPEERKLCDLASLR